MSLNGPDELEGPFPGLAPFSEQYADYFFGRSDESIVVADNLLARRLSIVYGPSGAGKSSLLRVGVPAQAEASSGWPCNLVICSSWTDGAEAALRGPIAKATGAHAEGDLGSLLAEAVDRGEGRLLLILDQFEELLWQQRIPEEALLEALADEDPEVNILISVREDAVAGLDVFDADVPGLFDNMIRLERLDTEAGREAIVEPVAKWNSFHGGKKVGLGNGLVDKIVDEIASKDGKREIQAPYLQLVMARLWRERSSASGDGSEIRLEDLERLGGVSGIVADHVDLALSSYSAADRDRIDAMLAGMVTPSGARIALTKTDLARYGETSPAETDRIVQGLTGGAQRLLEPAGETHYHLTHDALAEPIQDWRERNAERRSRRREWRRLFAVMSFVAALLVAATLTHALELFELATVDARFALRGAQPPPSDLLLVNIDEASLQRLKTEWPIPRGLDGQAVDYIGNGHPKAIAYDVDFSGNGREDRSLVESILGDASHVVLAAEATAPGGRVNILGGNEALAEMGARPGYSQFPFEAGGVTRHPLYARDGVRSFAVATAEVATGKRISSRGVEDAWIDFYGPAGTFKSIPFWMVIDHRVPASIFNGKIVVVGLTTLARDRHAVWGLHHHDMSGAELQANAIETVKRGLPLRSVATWIGVLLTILFAMLPVLPRRFPGRRGRRVPHGRVLLLVLVLAVAVAYLGVAILAFNAGLVLPVAAPLTALVLAAFALALISATSRA
jgi:CHASE2 domain-containing sensor protein